MYVKTIGLTTLLILLVSLVAPLGMASTTTWSQSTNTNVGGTYSKILLKTIEKCENLLKRIGVPEDSKEWRMLNEIKDLYAKLIEAEKNNDYVSARKIFREGMEKARELTRLITLTGEEDHVEQLEHIIRILEKAINNTQKLINKSLEKNIINDTLAEQLRQELEKAIAKLDELKEYLEELRNNETEWDPEYVNETVREIWSIIKDVRRTIFEEVSKAITDRLREKAKELINIAEKFLSELRMKEDFFREKNLTRIADKIDAMATRLENEINMLKQVVENTSAKPADLLRHIERVTITMYTINIALSILLDFTDEAAKMADHVSGLLSRLNEAISRIEEKVKGENISSDLKEKLLEILSLDHKLVNDLKDLVYAAASGNKERFVEVINEVNETGHLIKEKVDEIKNATNETISVRVILRLQARIADLTIDLVKKSRFMLVAVERSEGEKSRDLSRALTIVMNKLEVVIKVSNAIKCRVGNETIRYLEKAYDDLYAAKQYIVNKDFEKAKNKLEDASNNLEKALEKLPENKRLDCLRKDIIMIKKLVDIMINVLDR
ncbi:MAG: hypothetical protein DRO16_03540 [Thermoprotei archaeon]|nr:MAG: hypothetical protein DRO16_03540 [Thermoprotei archaeon]